ncbi:MAG: hypothetical protein O3B05_03170 [archaeon]|nr:hypothetical protein [archaeon]
MGLEVVVVLVHRPSLDAMLRMTWAEVDDGMQQRTLRDQRPHADARLVRHRCRSGVAGLVGGTTRPRP